MKLIRKKKTKEYFKLMNLKKSLIQVVDMEVIDKLKNKYDVMGDCDNIIMKYNSLFDEFIKMNNCKVFVGHWKFDNYTNKDNSIYFLDCDLSIIHARTIISKNNQIGILLNCQYCIINKDIKYVSLLKDYPFYIDNPLNSEYINELNKYVIFNLNDALIIK